MHEILRFNILYWDIIKFPYFVETTKNGVLFVAWGRGGKGWGMFSIFLNKGFDLDFLKVVVGRRISRKRKNNNNNMGRRMTWELVGWWECALVVVATICCPSLSLLPLPATLSQQLMKSYLDCSCCFYWCHGT